MFSARQRARIDLGAQFGKRVGPLPIAVIVMASMLWSWDVFCQTPPTDPASPPPASPPVNLTLEQQAELQYAAQLNDQAARLWKAGKSREALSLIEQAPAIWKKVVGEQHPRYATSLNNLAVLYDSMGEYGKAEPLYQQALAIRKKVLGELHPDYATNLNNLANLYHEMGEYTKAELLHRQALAIRKKVLGKFHPDYAQSLSNLAVLYSDMREYAKAEPLYQESLSIQKKVLGEQHPDYARSLNSLAALYLSMGEYVKAEPLLQQAFTIQKKVVGEQRPDYATSLNNLAGLYASMGEYAKAEPFYQQALAITRKVLGEQHPDYAQSLDNLAGLYASMNQHGRAAELADQAARLQDELAGTFFTVASEAQCLNYAAKMLGPNLLLSEWGPAARPVDGLYAAVWRRRGLMERAIAGRQEAMRLSAAASDNMKLQQYLACRHTLASLLLAPAGGNSGQLDARRERIEQLSETKERLERELAASVPALRELLESQRRPHTDLKDRLPINAVLVDTLRYRHFEQDANRPGKAGQKVISRYTAFIIAAGQPVRRVELGPVEPINRAIDAWRQSLVSGRREPLPADLRRRLWEPIEQALPPGTTTVYLCPDDALTRLPWTALPGRKPGTVLLENYALAVVPNGQVLLERLLAAPESAEAEGSLLAVGGVDYQAEPRQTPRFEELASAAMVRSAALDTDQAAWPNLPGTRAEVEMLVALAEKRPRIVLSTTEASTTRVLQELPHARWAHFATHGFFADKKFRSALQLDEKVFERDVRLFGDRRTVAGRNPLVLSGLVLAGANRPRPKNELGLPQGDGGILTAEAIAGLDLRKLDLVVLSACETGLGDVAGGEGVMGLTRAFHIAGARSVVASLWQVNDAATKALMAEFYRNLWERNLSKLEALRQAQLTMLRHYDPKDGKLRGAGPLRPVDPQRLAAAQEANVKPREPLAPFYWAAFVLSGDGR